MLESTTYPTTTRTVVLPRLLNSGLNAGSDFFLAFSPERVDPGNTKYGTRNTPKVVGGITDDCRRVAVALYQPAIDTLVPVSTTDAAARRSTIVSKSGTTAASAAAAWARSTAARTSAGERVPETITVSSAAAP